MAENTLRELTTHPELLARFGPLPVIPLPQDDEPLIVFIDRLVRELKDKGLYRRGPVVVVPMPGERKLMTMEPKMFVSWIQHFVATSKLKLDRNDDPRPVLRDMPTEVAEKVLMSLDFWPHVPEIDEVHAVPMPTLAADGSLELMGEGYHEASKTFTFGLE